ncbi:NAD(P)H dehydrogenase [Neobacillus piezotolerans]|uniref:FMN dependent NADH:quinone oxidoreductase n=1 Tax=Neobacillus piezotolerans TaxID=2259171 RepID=A0A3D8GNG5_9BACI|nr:NAD(P)H-dependent oxidoreductase [Neobacillus piezotolerans]RDU35867.1 NAD(P)H dehydrogenase [Neobacillus piezotolerans]
MAKLLYISANPKGPEKSKGMQIGEAFLQSFSEEQPDIEIKRIDLFQLDMVRMDAELISARGKLAGYGMSFEDLTDQEKSKIIKMHALAEEFIKYDYFVFVTPLWNLSSPAVLKTFLDNLFVTGKTFVHTANGPKGLLEGKTAIHIQTRGGLYTGMPMAELESGDRYLKIALRFMGIRVLDSVIAEGLDAFPKKAPEIVEETKARAIIAAKEMARKPVVI